MKRIYSLCLIFMVAAGLAVAQDTSSDSGIEQGENGAVAWKQTTVSGVILEIDKENQEVTIEGQNGYTYNFAIDQGVDLEQLNKGDTVTASFFRSLAVELREPTEEERQNPLQVMEGTATAPPGTDPGAGGLAQIKAVVIVENVNESEQIISVRGPQGYSYDIYVPDSNKLKDVNRGEEIVVIYTEALAVSLQKN